MDDPKQHVAFDTRVGTTDETLKRIAGILGCPVSAFHTGEGLPPAHVGGGEILALWAALKTDESRQAVLKLVQAIVEAQ